MGRLQDFQNVTPTSSDKILIVQSQGQGLAPHTIKLDSANPTGTGKLSMNRLSGSQEGTESTTLGHNCTASGNYSLAEGNNSTASGNNSHAEGSGTTASGSRAHAEGVNTNATGEYAHSEGNGTQASGESAHAEGYQTTASGEESHVEGVNTIANHRSQHVFGEYNIADTSTASATSKGTYIEIVGKGNSTTRSNARTLDWSGNEVLAGGLTVNGHSSAIGTIESGTATGTVSVPDNTITEMGSITLTAGKWLILACADWQPNGTGYRQISFVSGTNPSRNSAITTFSAGQNKETYQQLMQFVSFTQTTEQKVYALHNSGSALNVYPYIYAIRIA